MAEFMQKDLREGKGILMHGERLPDMMKTVGFVDVRRRRFKIEIGPWGSGWSPYATSLILQILEDMVSPQPVRTFGLQQCTLSAHNYSQNIILTKEMPLRLWNRSPQSSTIRIINYFVTCITLFSSNWLYAGFSWWDGGRRVRGWAASKRFQAAIILKYSCLYPL